MILVQKFRAPPNPFPSQKTLATADPLAAALAEQAESSYGATASGHDRSASDASDDWEEVRIWMMRPGLHVIVRMCASVVVARDFLVLIDR